MKVFFAGSYRGIKDFKNSYEEIFNEIKRLGYLHLDDEIVTTSYEDFVKKMEKGRDAYVDHYRNKMQAIHDADICVFETSSHSLGIGYLVEKSLTYGKPTIVLYYKEYVPYFLSGVDNEKLIVRSYDDKNYKEIVQETLELARERRDKRFNFFLSPKLLDYLEEASNKAGVTKSKLIRDMIVEHMRSNTEEVVE